MALRLPIVCHSASQVDACGLLFLTLAFWPGRVRETDSSVELHMGRCPTFVFIQLDVVV